MKTLLALFDKILQAVLAFALGKSVAKSEAEAQIAKDVMDAKKIDFSVDDVSPDELRMQQKLLRDRLSD